MKSSINISKENNKENESTKPNPITEKRKINRIKNISNSNLECQEIDISTKKEKHEKRLEVSEEEGKKIKNKNGEKDANNYFDFNAHFKYNELVEALNTLKNDKNESNSKNNKTTKEKESEIKIENKEKENEIKIENKEKDNKKFNKKYKSKDKLN